MFVINGCHVGQQGACGTCAHVCEHDLHACVATGPCAPFVVSTGQGGGHREQCKELGVSRSVLREPFTHQLCDLGRLRHL